MIISLKDHNLMHMKILLVDPVGIGGHHQEYTSLLAGGLKALGARVYFLGHLSLLNALTSESLIYDGTPIYENPFGSNIFNNEIRRFWFHQKTISSCRKFSADICHFLYMDHLLLSAAFCGIMRNKEVAVCGTLHRMYFLPDFALSKIHKLKGGIDIAALRFLLSGGLRIMTHSEELTSFLDKTTGTSQFDYTPYPVKTYRLTNEERKSIRTELRSRYRFAPNDVVLLLFGDTRYEKGADLAVKALSFLPSQYHLIIAGRSTYFSQTDLEHLASEFGVLDRLHFDNRVIPEEERPFWFCGCDIFLMPYRKTFSGQSGPLTVAAGLGTKIVAPDLPILAETIVKDDLGLLYPVENVELMASTVKKAMNMTYPPFSANRFNNEHSFVAFTNAVLLSYSKAKR